MRSHFWSGLLSLLLLMAFLAGCAQDAGAAVQSGTALPVSASYTYADEDLDASWDAQTASAVPIFIMQPAKRRRRNCSAKSAAAKSEC